MDCVNTQLHPNVPVELFDLVLSFLSARDLLTAARVCKQWHHLAMDQRRWKSLFDAMFRGHFRKDLFADDYRRGFRDRLIRSQRRLNKLAVIGTDHNLYIVDPNTSALTQLTFDASPSVHYLQPCWSPHAEFLSVARIEQLSNLRGFDTYRSSMLIKFIANNGSAIDLIDMETNFASYYSYWTPDGSCLTYLGSIRLPCGRRTIALRILDVSRTLSVHYQSAMTDAEGIDYCSLQTATFDEVLKFWRISLNGTPQDRQSAPSVIRLARNNQFDAMVYTGSPFFFSFSPSAFNLVAHINGREIIVIHDVTTYARQSISLIDSGILRQDASQKSLCPFLSSLMLSMEQCQPIPQNTQPVVQFRSKTAPFSCPHWGDDDRLIYAILSDSHDNDTRHGCVVTAESPRATNPDGSAIRRQSSQDPLHPDMEIMCSCGGRCLDHSKKEHAIFDFVGAVTFVASYCGFYIATSEYTKQRSFRVFDRVNNRIIEIETDNEVLAYFWSPDAMKLIYFTRDPNDQTHISLWVWSWHFIPHYHDANFVPRYRKCIFANTGGNTSKQPVTITQKGVLLAHFVPSPTLVREYLRFFDQCSRSMTFCSPNSEQFVVAMDSTDGQMGVWIQDLPRAVEEPVRTPRHICNGVIATWSPQ